MIKYIELKTGYNDNGPAWIGKVSFSKSGQTIYFKGKAFKKIHGGGFAGNYHDFDTGDEYWISGVKKSGLDRHWAGSGKIKIQSTIVDEYLNLIDEKNLDTTKFEVFEAIEYFSKEKFHSIENEKL